FQAEDGIRDRNVTGVQTCALPISAHIDFTGTSAQLPSNFNAPSAVARAAVLYVMRTLVEDNIPLNDGCLKPVDITIPDDSMLSRSEERRVGKECRCRVAQGDAK